jgi:ABC-type sugar transport system substrate-binding protein
MVSDTSKVEKVEKVRVLLVNPSIESDPFWHKIELITKQAATELNFELDVIYGQGTRFFQLEELKKYFKSHASPEYVVLINYPGHAKISMDFLQQNKVKVITLEQTLTYEEKVVIGEPGEIYNNWIGEIDFDNASAGNQLARHLIDAVKAVNKKPIVAGISGHFGSESTLRNSGLLAAIDESGAYLTQIVHAGWSAEDAYLKTQRLLKRYPDINIIWCASDHMALGVVKAIEDMNKKVGVDILVGGFDWTNKGIKSINEGKLTTSIGGHFMMGAIAMIAIDMEEKGINHRLFSNEINSSFELALIDKRNITQYLELLQSEDLSMLSFKKLAKLYEKRSKRTSIALLDMLNNSFKTQHKKTD